MKSQLIQMPPKVLPRNHRFNVLPKSISGLSLTCQGQTPPDVVGSTSKNSGVNEEDES
jgi:hypothetical protein